MKMANVKSGAIVFNKIDGNVYKVMMVLEGSGSAQAVLLNPETHEPYVVADPEYKEVSITEKNAIIFRTISVPESSDIPTGYHVDNGILYDKENKKVTEQGEIVIDYIIDTLPGYLVLGVKPRNEEAAENGNIALFTYNPEQDKFRELIRRTVPRLTVIRKLDDMLILAYSKEHREDVYDENGAYMGRKKRIFDSAGIIAVKGKRAMGLKFHFPLDLDKVVPVKGTYCNFLIGSSEDVMSGEIVDSKPRYWMIKVLESGMIENDFNYYQYGIIENASVAHFDGEQLFIKGKDFLVCGDLEFKTPLIEKLPGDYIVDVTRKDHEVTVTLADDDYNTYSIVSKSTRDRGSIYSLA